MTIDAGSVPLASPAYLLQYTYKFGMVVSNDPSFPNTRINISSGQARDFRNYIDIPIGGILGTPNYPYAGQPTSTPLVIDITKNGINGLNEGTVEANSIYQFFILADSSYKNPIGGLLQKDSFTDFPIIPAGYNAFRSLGYCCTDGSANILKMWNSGDGDSGSRTFRFDVPQATAITAGNDTSYTAISLLGRVPTLNGNEYCRPVLIESIFTPVAANSKLYMQPGDGTGDMITINGQVAGVPIISYTLVQATYTDDVMTINYKVSSGSDAVAINVAGFIF